MKRILHFICSLFLLFSCGEAIETYDLVIADARVIDPETNTDAIKNIGIKDGKIVNLGSEVMRGDEYIDAKGKYAIPGCIDLNTHSPFPFGESFQIRDGVTTMLDLQVGSFPVMSYGSFFKEKHRSNFGSSVGYTAIRLKVMEGVDRPYVISEDGEVDPGEAFSKTASKKQIAEMRDLLHEGLDQGGLGIGLLLDDVDSKVSRAELKMIFQVAAEREVVVWSQFNRLNYGDTSVLNELIRLSQEKGTAVHVSQVSSTAIQGSKSWLEIIDNANQHGADMSFEVSVYNAQLVPVSSDVFRGDWQKRFNISYSDIQSLETGESLNKKSLAEKRKNDPDGYVIYSYLKQDSLINALMHPRMILVSGAMPAINMEQKSKPNVAASFTRLFSKYVRDDKLLTLNQAVAMTSYLPAKRLEKLAPAFKKKGRIQEGADADILLFDLENLKDNATYAQPYQYSSGWDYVIVGGIIVMRFNEDTGYRPGVRMLGRGKWMNVL